MWQTVGHSGKSTLTTGSCQRMLCRGILGFAVRRGRRWLPKQGLQRRAAQLSSARLGLLRSAAQRSSDRRSACRTELTARNGSWAARSVFMARAHSYVEQQSLAKGVLPGLPTSFKSPNLRTRNYWQGLSSMKNHHHYYKRDGATLLRCRKH